MASKPVWAHSGCGVLNIYVKRDANYAAHYLARKASSCVINKVWINEISYYIYGIVTKEQMSHEGLILLIKFATLLKRKKL